ncbi:MAG: rhomboid family intramembrane serine protease, partial [Myxococcota bacterium]
GIFGLLGAGFVFGWRYRARLPGPMSVFLRRRLAPWIVINLIIGMIIPFIDNLGHTGGLIGGSILAMILGNPVVPGEQSPRWMRWASVGLSAALLGFALWGVLR